MRIISESQADDVLLKEIGEMATQCGVSSVDATKYADAVGEWIWRIQVVPVRLGENAKINLKKWESLSEADKITVAQQLFKSLLEGSTEDIFIGIRGTIEDLLEDQEQR